MPSAGVPNRLGSPPSVGSLGPYRIEERIGQGGMAEVYRVRKEGPSGFEKVLALKRILPSYAAEPQIVARFLDEARLCARLDHANIVQVVDFGSVGDEYYLVMELIDGASLSLVLRNLHERRTSLPPEVAAHLIAEAAEGLHYAHNLSDVAGSPLGLVHRDVSPQNILLSRQGDVKVADFGIAKAIGSTARTATGVQIGKLCYMSPEQVSNETLDSRADVYALGVVLWECLTNRPLFPRGLDENALKAVLEPCVAAPSSVSSAPAALDRLVLHALAPSRANRLASAGVLARDLRAWLHGVAPGFGRSDLAAFLASHALAARAAPVVPGVPTATYECPAQPTRVEVPAKSSAPLPREQPRGPQGPAAQPPETRAALPTPSRARRGWFIPMVSVSVVSLALAGLVLYAASRLSSFASPSSQYPATENTPVQIEPIPPGSPGSLQIEPIPPGSPGSLQIEPIPPGSPGSLLIESEPPGAWVLIDRAFQGTTPLTPRDVQGGAAPVALMLRGHVPALFREAREIVGAGPIRLTPTATEYALVEIDCNSATNVAVDGQDIGPQPRLVVLELLDGRPTAAVSLVGIGGEANPVNVESQLRPWDVARIGEGSGCPSR